MTVFSSSQPSLRTRVLPRFPARVVAGAGMTITKDNGTYTFESTATAAAIGTLPDGTLPATGAEFIAVEQAGQNVKFTLDDILVASSPNPGDSYDTDSIGYKGIPVATHNAVYTFVVSDNGTMTYHSEAFTRTWTIDTHANQALDIGAVIMIYNGGGAGTLTIHPAATVTLRRADGVVGTGDRTVAADSLATIIQVALNSWIISGAFT